MTLPKGPMSSTVGIRQVRANGVKLDEAMVLDVIGAPLTNETTDDNLPAYRLDLSSLISLQGQITALTARVVTLEGQLAGTIPIDTLELRRIIAAGTGNPPAAGLADFEIVTKTAVEDVYDQLFKVVGANPADESPEPKLSFFGTTASGLRILPGGWTSADLQDALEAYRLVVE